MVIDKKRLHWVQHDLKECADSKLLSDSARSSMLFAVTVLNELLKDMPVGEGLAHWQLY
jgi:hypothetical protein